MKLRCCAALLAVALLPAGAAAQQTAELERAKASFKAGATAYAAGEYLAAIQALDAAYALTPVPAIAFSLAQAERRQYFVSHERQHLDRATALFRRYIEQVPAGGRRADALEALSQLEPLAAVLERPPGGKPPLPDGEVHRRTRLMVSSETPGARVSIDGGPPAPSPLIREVEPGRHTVAITAPGFYPEERQVTALQGELIPEAIALREQPSTVIVSAPPDAELYVDGVFASRGGERVVLELSSGPHRLGVAEPGHRLLVRRLDLERGASQSVHVELEPTLQRKAAVVLFWSGAAALTTGAVFGTLALNAERGAQGFLTRQAQGNVTSSELADYQADQSDRARDRAATAISFAVSAGLLITGAFLHQLDRPTSEQVSRAGSDRSSHRFVPVALPGGGGAFFRAAF